MQENKSDLFWTQRITSKLFFSNVVYYLKSNGFKIVYHIRADDVLQRSLVFGCDKIVNNHFIMMSAKEFLKF